MVEPFVVTKYTPLIRRYRQVKLMVFESFNATLEGNK